MHNFSRNFIFLFFIHLSEILHFLCFYNAFFMSQLSVVLIQACIDRSFDTVTTEWMLIRTFQTISKDSQSLQKTRGSGTMKHTTRRKRRDICYGFLEEML